MFLRDHTGATAIDILTTADIMTIHITADTGTIHIQGTPITAHTIHLTDPTTAHTTQDIQAMMLILTPSMELTLPLQDIITLQDLTTMTHMFHQLDLKLCTHPQSGKKLYTPPHTPQYLPHTLTHLQ